MPDWSEHIFRIEALPLEILKFRAGYITSAPVELPPFSGGVFRGLFGRVLKRLHTVVDFRGQEKTLMGIIVHQARAVARFLRQEAGDYVPFSARW